MLAGVAIMIMIVIMLVPLVESVVAAACACMRRVGFFARLFTVDWWVSFMAFNHRQPAA